MVAMTSEKLWTVSQITEYLDVSERTLLTWLREGKLRGFRLGGTKAGWRVEDSELRRFIEEMKRQTAASGEGE